MNTKPLYSLMAVLMAVLMFSSSIGLSMDVHFCGNELKNYSFFGDTEACEMMQVKKVEETKHACCSAPKKELKTCKNQDKINGICCHNEILILENGGDFESQNFSLKHIEQVITLAIVLFPDFNWFEITAEPNKFTPYIPPPLIKDIPVLNQVFRI